MSTTTQSQRRDQPLLSCERAWGKILARAKPLERVGVSLDDACGMVLAESVRAPRAVPPFDNSAMDGFAVRAADLRGPIDPSPICLEIVATIPAGAHWRGKIQLGQAAKIMTGAALPRGANTVVPVESTQEEGGWVEVLTMPAMGSHVRRRGGDLARGRVALRRGTRLSPAALTLIASLGLTRVTCWRRPRVAVLT
jgi:molybdopterin molybdotransferase